MRSDRLAALEFRRIELEADNPTRCGLCWSPATANAENDGYSSCCNDRIEHPNEYLDDPDYRRALAADEVRC